MNDEQVFFAIAILAVIISYAIAFVLGALWGTTRAERRYRTPRIPLRPVGLADAVDR